MKNKTLCILLIFLVSNLFSQNWNVFNKNYRYNYKYNQAAVISQVLFADSVKQTGTDTTYYLNRIGVECTGNCPGFTAIINPTVVAILPNMPQFLQRRIKKLANGWVVLKDTATLVIKPNCVVAQSWLFDSIGNQTALCVNKLAKTLFGINDSIKTILIGGTDTLILSKNFGIVQFPNLYNKNKYYRLVGVENANSYDATALYGLKVPNAWDFYNYNVGDKFCYQWNRYYLHSYDYFAGSYTVTGKYVGANAYHYSVTNLNSTTLTANYPETYTALSTPFPENKMYPGQIITTYPYATALPASWSSGIPYNIVRFGLDNNGTFYKAAGVPCIFLPAVNFPSYGNQPQGGYLLNNNSTYFEFRNWNSANAYFESGIVYGSGLGKIVSCYSNFPEYLNMAKTCAVKNGSVYYGNPNFVGLSENTNSDSGHFKLYPNPASENLNIGFYSEQSTPATLRIYNAFGQLVVEEIIAATQGQNTHTLSIDHFAKGVYLVSFKTETGTAQHKLIKE